MFVCKNVGKEKSGEPVEGCFLCEDAAVRASAVLRVNEAAHVPVKLKICRDVSILLPCIHTYEEISEKARYVVFLESPTNGQRRGGDSSI